MRIEEFGQPVHDTFIDDLAPLAKDREAMRRAAEVPHLEEWAPKPLPVKENILATHGIEKAIIDKSRQADNSDKVLHAV